MTLRHAPRGTPRPLRRTRTRISHLPLARAAHGDAVVAVREQCRALRGGFYAGVGERRAGRVGAGRVGRRTCPHDVPVEGRGVALEDVAVAGCGAAEGLA